MSSLRQKAEKTVGSLSQEIEMMSADLVTREHSFPKIELRRKEEKHRRTAEADAERLQREPRRTR